MSFMFYLDVFIERTEKIHGDNGLVYLLPVVFINSWSDKKRC